MHAWRVRHRKMALIRIYNESLLITDYSIRSKIGYSTRMNHARSTTQINATTSRERGRHQDREVFCESIS